MRQAPVRRMAHWCSTTPHVSVSSEHGDTSVLHWWANTERPGWESPRERGLRGALPRSRYDRTNVLTGFGTFPLSKSFAQAPQRPSESRSRVIAAVDLGRLAKAPKTASTQSVDGPAVLLLILSCITSGSRWL